MSYGICELWKWLDADVEGKAQKSSFCEQECREKSQGSRIIESVNADIPFYHNSICDIESYTKQAGGAQTGQAMRAELDLVGVG